MNLSKPSAPLCRGVVGRYEAVIRACALSDDVAAMDGGDLMRVGSRGSNLSGGQRARIALARWGGAPLSALNAMHCTECLALH